MSKIIFIIIAVIIVVAIVVGLYFATQSLDAKAKTSANKAINAQNKANALLQNANNLQYTANNATTSSQQTQAQIAANEAKALLQKAQSEADIAEAQYEQEMIKTSTITDLKARISSLRTIAYNAQIAANKAPILVKPTYQTIANNANAEADKLQLQLNTLDFVSSSQNSALTSATKIADLQLRADALRKIANDAQIRADNAPIYLKPTYQLLADSAKITADNAQALANASKLSDAEQKAFILDTIKSKQIEETNLSTQYSKIIAEITAKTSELNDINNKLKTTSVFSSSLYSQLTLQKNQVSITISNLTATKQSLENQLTIIRKDIATLQSTL